MARRHRLSGSRTAVSKHERLARCRAALGKAFGPEAIAKASTGTGLVLLAGAAPAAAVNPMLGMCLGYLSLAPGIGGTLGLAEIRSQREKVAAHELRVKREIRRYIRAKKKQAR